MTVSVLASTRIFMKPLASLPEIVFFIGLHAQPVCVTCPEQDGPHLKALELQGYVHTGGHMQQSAGPEAWREPNDCSQHWAHGLQSAESHFLRNLS